MAILPIPTEDQNQLVAESTLDPGIGEICPEGTQLALFEPPEAPKPSARIVRIWPRMARRRRGRVDPTQASLFPDLL